MGRKEITFKGLGRIRDGIRFFRMSIRGPVNWFGTHTISAGANLSSVELAQTATRGEIQALRANLTLDRLTTFAGNPDFYVSNTLAGRIRAGFVVAEYARGGAGGGARGLGPAVPGGAGAAARWR